MEEVIDGILEGGRVSPVVLGRDKDESGMFLDLEAPSASVRVGVLGMVGHLRGDGGFVEEGEVPACEVDEMEVGRRGDEGIVVVVLDGFDYEGSDLGADAGLAGGADNDTYGWGRHGECGGKVSAKLFFFKLQWVLIASYTSQGPGQT